MTATLMLDAVRDLAVWATVNAGAVPAPMRRAMEKAHELWRRDPDLGDHNDASGWHCDASEAAQDFALLLDRCGDVPAELRRLVERCEALAISRGPHQPDWWDVVDLNDDEDDGSVAEALAG